jgi:cytochrome c-type biogenesis protein CcmH
MTTFLWAAAAFLALAMSGFLFGVAAGDTGDSPHGTARLARARWVLALAPVSIALASAGLYAWIGNTTAEEAPTSSMPTAPVGMELPVPVQQAGDLESMSSRLASRLAREPGDGDGWALLGRAYVEMGRYPEAEEAFAKAANLSPRDASVLADWAEAHFLAHGRNWDPKTGALAKRALAVDPGNAKALALVRGETAVHRDGGPAKTASIAGVVKLSESLRSTIAPSDTVFVLARTLDGRGPPLAVKRLRAAELPAKFRLDDGDAMVPGRLLSSAAEIALVARLSRTGEALSQPGDIESDVVRTKPGTKDVVLMLGGTQPSQ